MTFDNFSHKNLWITSGLKKNIFISIYFIVQSDMIVNDFAFCDFVFVDVNILFLYSEI